MELRDVEHVHLAHAVKIRIACALALLFGLRLIAGALLPLSADEAYYWLWSRHLAAGYYDHPPAIAFLIQTGTWALGQTPFGVRIAGILLSVLASFFVFDAARTLTKSGKAAWLSCLFFNLSLMTTVETLVATPDTPLIPAAAGFFWALSKIAARDDRRYWLAAGLFAGLGLLSKFSMLFFGAGALVWLIAAPPMRRALRSPWPYLGGVLALGLFLPNLLWNANHGWATFAFQFGRIEGGHLTLKYLGEFVGAQALLASPFLFILALAGLFKTRWQDKGEALVAALVWPSIAYFLIHCLHDRVQGNWPCYLYPALSVAAAAAFLKTDWQGWKRPLMAWSVRLAVPLAALLLVVGYAQALIGVVPMGRKDPLARLLAVGLPEVVEKIDSLRQGAPVVTTDYATSAWLSFYGRFAVVSVGEDYRWADLPAVRIAGPSLYVAEDRRDLSARLSACFSSVTPLEAPFAVLDRSRKGVAIAHYRLWRLGPAKQPCGRMP